MLTLDVHSWYTYLYGVMQTWTKHCLVYRFHTGLHNTTGFGQVCITITPQVCITNNTVLARFCSGLHHRAKPWPSYGVKEIDHTMHHWRTCMRCHLTHLHAEHAHAAPWCSQLCSHLGLGCTSVAHCVILLSGLSSLPMAIHYNLAIAPSNICCLRCSEIIGLLGLTPILRRVVDGIIIALDRKLTRQCTCRLHKLEDQAQATICDVFWSERQ